MSRPIVYIVVPCFNEEKCIDETSARLKNKLKDLINRKIVSNKSAIVFVDDGSRDKTWDKILSLSESCFIGLKLSHNKGHQNALLAGLIYSKDYADAIISIDADLQDDIDTIDKMVLKYVDGNEIVYGVRSERKKDTFFKRNSAQLFYKMMRFIGVEIVYNSADYRLMSKRAVEELSRYKEANLFLRGIIPLIGLKWTTVEYSRSERFAGESKYPFKKMLSFAWEGITSFSVKPLRFILAVGVIVFFLSLIVLLYSFIQYLNGNTVSGWAFTVCSIWLVGGLQMASIGLIGEYIGKIYTETKQRPRYFIEEIYLANNKK